MSKIFIALGIIVILALGAWKLHLFRKTKVINQAGSSLGTSSTTGNNQSSVTTSTPPHSSGSSGQTLSLSLAYAGVTRTYLLHLPAAYSPQGKYPLLLSFHGHFGKGAGQESMTGFDAVADANGFLVAYPDSNPSWGDGTQWQLTGANNDIEFAKALIASIESHYAVDSSRIYVTGFSEGGGMAAALTCSDASHIAGFADVSTDMSSTFASHCTPAAPVTTIYFHGTADPVSPYSGGLGGATTRVVTNSALQTAQFWAKVNGCAATPTTSSVPDHLSDGSSVTDSVATWSGCQGGTTVTLYTITGGGHAWPGYAAYSGKYGPGSEGLNASQIIWDTLSQYRR